MRTHDTSPGLIRMRFAVTVAMAIMLVMAGSACTAAHAQGAYGFAQGFSPFATIPWFRGEMRVTPIWIGIISGTNTLPAFNKSWGLRTTFNMTKSSLFVDLMARIQLGAVSFRVHGEQRDFVGTTSFQNTPGRVKTEARLEFSGWRGGLDIDLFSRYGIKAGINGDYYWYNPVFTESVQTNGGKKLLGENPLTFGFHASCTVPREFLGAWPVVEARVSWPAKIYTSPEITDVEIAVGLRGPGTILGSLGVRSGYRRTSLTFTDAQLYGGISTQNKFDTVLSGWFGELVYYY